MRYLAAWLAWFLTPDYADYNANPIIFWIQVCIAGSLYAFARVCNLRLDKTAQQETQWVAEEISTQIKPHFPQSWKYLTEETNGIPGH